MNKKIRIAVLFLFFLIIGIGIYMYVLNSKEKIDTYGVYVSEQNKLTIEITDKVVRITELESNYLYNYMYSMLYNENMDKEGFENYVQNFIINMENGVAYERDEDGIYFWPVEGDAANFCISLLGDDIISLFNVEYTKDNNP